MNTIKPWSKVPTDWIRDGTIKHFRWQGERSTNTAALIVFVALCHVAAEVEIRKTQPFVKRTVTEQAVMLESFVGVVQVSPSEPYQAVGAKLTYDELGEITGLSRKLISAALTKLEMLGMIERTERASEYLIQGLGNGWAKVPGKALLSPSKVALLPFTRFTLRSKHELNAMKLYLYYASVRDNATPYSTASFETIYQKTGVPERDIPIANSLLITTGLLTRAHRDTSQDAERHEANRYYMTGYNAMFIAAKTAA